MRINTVIGMGKRTFLPQVQKKFGLQRYDQPFHWKFPLFVFGCGSGKLKNLVMQHRGFAVILWTGSDTLTLHTNPRFLDYLHVNKSRIFNITFSHWCKTDLEHFGIAYRHRLIIQKDVSKFSFVPETKGEIYHYGSEERPWYYGTETVQKIEKIWDSVLTMKNPEFNYAVYGKYRPKLLHQVYADSILGVRLTEHDGIAGSVLEMGLMGRRTIYNDPQIPSAIPYMSNPYLEYNPEVKSRWCYQNGTLAVTVLHMIKEELENRPEPDKLLAEQMHRHRISP